MRKTLFIFSLLAFYGITHVFAEPQEKTALQVQTYEQLVSAIKQTRAESENRARQAVNQEKVREAWEIGKLVDEHILLHKERADYGKRMIPQLAFDIEVGETELRYMIQFAKVYPMHPPADELTWSHYRELLSLNDDQKRKEVTVQAVKEHWTRDRLREEIDRRQSAPKAPAEKLTAVPGIPSVYRLVTAPEGPYKGQLVLDLGFSNYFKFGNMNEFKAGDLVNAAPVKQSKKGLATRFHFKRVLPKSYLESVHLSVGDQYVVADESSLYTYPAYVAEVVDGTTFKAVLDLGFGFTSTQTLRLRRLEPSSGYGSSGCKAPARLENGVCVTEDPDAYRCPEGSTLKDGKCISKGTLIKGGCKPPGRIENGICVTEDPSAYRCPEGSTLKDGKCISKGTLIKGGCKAPARLENGVCVTEDPDAYRCPEGSTLKDGKCISKRSLINSPAVYKTNKKAALENNLKNTKQILVKVVRLDKQGYYYVDVWADQKYVNQMLIDEGHAIKVRD